MLKIDNEHRERNGIFFTPPIWASKGIEYITKALGEDWQDNYYVWDCCCGTGNLCVDLKRQDRLFLSTLEKAHIKIMQEENICPVATTFQFDFLNDDWLPVKEGGKIPDRLFKIIKEEPEKLVIYINPPYAESGNKRVVSSKGKERNKIGMSNKDLFIQFFERIYDSIQGCMLGCFSKLKHLNASKLTDFRNKMKIKFICGFLCPADTFDNVTGQFPIGFQVWNYDGKTSFEDRFKFDVFNRTNELICKKTFLKFNKGDFIVDWLKIYNARNDSNYIQFKAVLYNLRSDIQHSNYLIIQNLVKKRNDTIEITKKNFKQAFITIAVITCIKQTWLNDRDQFTAPFEKKYKIA